MPQSGGKSDGDEDRSMIDNLLERLRSGEADNTNKLNRATRDRGANREPRQRKTPERSASIVLGAQAAALLMSIQNEEDTPPISRVERENSRTSGTRTSSRSSLRRLIRSGSTGSIVIDEGTQGSVTPTEKDIEEEVEGQPF